MEGKKMVPEWVPGVCAAIFLIVGMILLVMSMVMEKIRTVTLVFAAINFVLMTVCTIWFVARLMKRPVKERIIQRTQEIPVTVPFRSHKLGDLYNMIDSLREGEEAAPELADELRHVTDQHLAHSLLDVLNDASQVREEVLQEPDEDTTPWYMKILNWIMSFIQTPIGATVATQLVENVGENDGGKGGESVVRKGSRVIIGLIGGVIILCCCVVLVGGFLIIRGDGSSDQPELKPLQEVTQQVPSGPTPILPVFITTSTPEVDSPMLQPLQSVPVTASAPTSGQITSWSGSCDKGAAWCFSGYTDQGSVHLYPWLGEQIVSNCSVSPASGALATWVGKEWEDTAGHFYPLRDWYRTHYEEVVNLTAEAANICAAFGGQPK